MDGTVRARRGLPAARRERLPPDHWDRFAEEWEAEVAAYEDRRLAALKWAIGIALGARNLAAELPPAPQPERATLLHPLLKGRGWTFVGVGSDALTFKPNRRPRRLGGRDIRHWSTG